MIGVIVILLLTQLGFASVCLITTILLSNTTENCLLLLSNTEKSAIVLRLKIPSIPRTPFMKTISIVCVTVHFIWYLIAICIIFNESHWNFRMILFQKWEPAFWKEGSVWNHEYFAYSIFACCSESVVLWQPYYCASPGILISWWYE